MTPSGPQSRAMVLTPRPAVGGAGIAVIRLSGAGVTSFLNRFLSRPPKPGRCIHVELRDDGHLIDDPVVLLSQDESWADLNLHGGAWVIASVLELARREGFEILESSGNIVPEIAFAEAASPLEREMLMHLPLALTEVALRLLLHQPKAWRADWEKNPDRLLKILQDQSLYRLLHPPRIAIIGPPNVGKSTIANQLFGKNHSITADLPGTTRDWVGEMANIDGLPAMLIDTPGYRDTDDTIERAAIAASQEQIQSADLVIRVFDATQAPTSPFEESGLIVINKTDLPAGWDFRSLRAIPISARTGKGLDELRSAVLKHFGIDPAAPLRPCWWTERQREILSAALNDPRMIKSMESEI